ncbi:hypothetical protein Aduo_014248 [Ancylostoma duodenale]
MKARLTSPTPSEYIATRNGYDTSRAADQRKDRIVGGYSGWKRSKKSHHDVTRIHASSGPARRLLYDKKKHLSEVPMDREDRYTLIAL